MAGRSTFIRSARLGVWERLLSLVQERRVQLGMTFLDGTTVRAHRKAAGAARKGALKPSEAIVKRLAALVSVWHIAPGQVHELPQVIPLLDSLPNVTMWVVADRG